MSLIRFQDKEDIRTIVKNNAIWICASDVFKALGHEKFNVNLIKDVPENFKGVNSIHTLGGHQDLWMLSEQGLYFILGRSRKKAALPFQLFMADAMEQIRRTGSFIDDNQALTTLDKNEIYLNLTNRIALLESAITPVQLTIINATEELPKRLRDIYDFDSPASFWTEKTMMVDLFFSAFTDGEINTIPLKKGLAMLISALTALNCKFKHGKHFVLLPPKKPHKNKRGF